MDFAEIFGEDDDLSMAQMAARAVVIFVICLLFIRFAGKRAFGLRMPLDNVITFLLGSLLSRAIVGASPFWPTVAAGGIIVLFYRIFCLLAVFSKPFGWLVKGRETVLFENGKMNRANMIRNMVTEHDLVTCLRLSGQCESFDDVEKIYVERSGEISIVRKPAKC